MSDAATDEQDRLDMARLAAGHDAALNDLMERHTGKLFHYLCRSLQDESDGWRLVLRVASSRHDDDGKVAGRRSAAARSRLSVYVGASRRACVRTTAHA